MVSEMVPGPTFSTPDKLITLKIGPNAKVFMVHKQFACGASPVLKAAFNSEFIEGQSQTYELNDIPEETGRLLVHWMYFRSIMPGRPPLGDIQKYEEDDAMLRLWIPADKLIMPELQNSIIESLFIQKTIKLPICTASLKYVYEQTAKDSKLRLFLVDLIAAYMDPLYFSRFDDHFPREFLIEFAQRIPLDMGPRAMERRLGLDRRLSRYQVPRG